MVDHKLKILVLGVHFEVTGARYIADAFTRLGHDVRHSGPEARLREAWGVDVPDKYIWTPDARYDENWRPDLIILADTQTTWMFDVPKGYYGIPIVQWVQDNHVRNIREEHIQHYFLAHAHGPAQPVSHDDETWLPCGFDPIAFTPSPIPWEQREWDICCIGVMYPKRAELCERLKAEGFRVLAGTGLVYEEYEKAYQNSRISLCVSAAGDVAQRVFETAAMGCTVLMDLTHDLSYDEVTNKQLGLSGMAVYQNADDCVVMARDLLGESRELAKGGATQLQDIVRTGHYTLPDGTRKKTSAWSNHTWDARAQVVVDWYEKEYGGGMNKSIAYNPDIDINKLTEIAIGGEVNGNNQATGNILMQNLQTGEKYIKNIHTNGVKRPYLNLGCGTTHLPSAKPAGHEAVDDAVYAYPLWVNVDKVEGVGADKTFDLFTYPWPLEDSSYDGALLAHIVEHVGHEIKINPEFEGGERAKDLAKLQDGWYAFFSELYRVLTPGALVHIVSPYGWSDGGITDPSHTRYLTLNTFTHSMTPEISDGSTFKYNNGSINFVIDGQPVYRFTPYAKLMQERTGFDLNVLLGLYLNMVYDFYIKLRVVK